MRISVDRELDSYVAECLMKLRAEHHRQPQKAAIGRANFLAQVTILAQEDEARATKSGIRNTERRAWIRMIPHYGKRSRTAMALISSLVIIVTLLFGAVSTGVYASQNSLPSDFLYPLKVLGEEIHLTLTLNPNTRMALLLRYSMLRLDEMLEMVANQEPFPEKIVIHWQEHINLALETAAQMEDPAMIRALEQIRLHLNLQEQRVQAAQASENLGLDRVRDRLHMLKGVVESALEDPAAFRLRRQLRYQPGDQFPPDDPLQATPERTLPSFDRDYSQERGSIQPSLDPEAAIGSRKRGESGGPNPTSSPDPELSSPTCAKDCMPTAGVVDRETELYSKGDDGNNMPAVSGHGYNPEEAGHNKPGTTSRGDEKVNCYNNEERSDNSVIRSGGGSRSP